MLSKDGGVAHHLDANAGPYALDLVKETRLEVVIMQVEQPLDAAAKEGILAALVYPLV